MFHLHRAWILLGIQGCWPLIGDPRPGRDGQDALEEDPVIDDTDVPGGETDPPIVETGSPDDLPDLRLIVIGTIYGQWDTHVEAYLTDDLDWNWWDAWLSAYGPCTGRRNPHLMPPDQALFGDPPACAAMVPSTAPDVACEDVAHDIPVAHSFRVDDQSVEDRRGHYILSSRESTLVPERSFDLVLGAWPELGGDPVRIRGVLSGLATGRLDVLNDAPYEFDDGPGASAVSLDLMPPWAVPYELDWADPTSTAMVVIHAGVNSSEVSTCAVPDDGHASLYLNEPAATYIDTCWLEGSQIDVFAARGETTPPTTIFMDEGRIKVSVEGIMLQMRRSSYRCDACSGGPPKTCD